jgi:hypothetical protein
MRIGEKRCNCSCFEIDHEMDAILLIIGIVLRSLPNRHKISATMHLFLIFCESAFSRR